MAAVARFPTDFTAKATPLAGTDKIPINGDREYVELDEVAAFASAARAPTQTVTSSPATLTAQDCILDDDSHDAMSPGVLTLPPITEGARHTIWTPYDGVFYSVVPDPDDVVDGVTISGSSSYLINSQIARVVAYQLIAIEAEGELGWYIDNGAERFINEIAYPQIVANDARLTVLEAGAFKTVEMSATPQTITDETLVSITATDATVALTLPAAVKGRVVAAVKANDNAAQTIVFTRAGSDKINDVSGNLTLVLANLPSGCRRPTWIARAVDNGEWEIDVADSATLQGLYNALVALTTRVTTLEAPTSVDKSAAAVSWTTEKRIRNKYTSGLATYTLNGSTGDWPVGESRLLSQYSASTAGFAIAVPSGHKLNGTTNGASGTLGTSAWAPGTPIYSVLVTREASDEWSWA